MTGVYGLYPDPASAQRAVNGLRAAGVAERDITVVSAEPIEEYEFSQRDQATWLHWIAPGGGALGLLFATWLTTMAEQAWPLNTGDMPIVTWWPNLIIMFELTMLGAMLATAITFLITAKLPRRHPGLYDAAVSDGLILVGVKDPAPATVGDVEHALGAAGSSICRQQVD